MVTVSFFACLTKKKTGQIDYAAKKNKNLNNVNHIQQIHL